MWSLKALAGIDELPPELPPLVVVVVDAELVELQAVAVAASSKAMPTAATRTLSDVRATFPPVTRPSRADDSPHLRRRAAWWHDPSAPDGGGPGNLPDAAGPVPAPSPGSVTLAGGRVAERTNAHASKACEVKASGGSNPPPSARCHYHNI